MELKKVLFLTWDGAEVNYLENLFAPIFIKLREIYGYEFHIIQFTYADDSRILQRKSDLLKMGLPYTGFQVNTSSLLKSMLKAKLWDVLFIKKYIKTHQIEVLMPRAVNSFFIIQSLIKYSSLKLVFDADGFPLDERVDFSGLSPLSWRYKFFRNVEFLGFHRADAILCRSKNAKEIIASRAGSGFDQKKVFVINNGTYVPAAIQIEERKREKSLTLVYAGSLGPQYMLDEMIGTFGLIWNKYSQARFKILTFKVEEIKNYIHQKFPQLYSFIEVKSVPSESVIHELKKADIALSFRKSSFSMLGVAPIKIAEYLGAGLSMIFTSGIGDMDELLTGQPFTFRRSTEIGSDSGPLLNWVSDQIEKDYQEGVLQFAKKHFSLHQTVEFYHQAIQYGK